MAKRYFGTDGVRGRVGEPPITADTMLKLGWAAGKALAFTGCNKVLIGKDTRISGYMFEAALEAGLTAAGLNTALTGPMPTPGIAYLTRTLRACAGIVISASHNPYFDNGIKFFSREGSKLPDALEKRIEALLDEPMQTAAPDRLGKAERIDDAAARYIEFCKSSVPFSFNLDGMKIVVDCANGATYHIAPSVFAELGADVIAIGDKPDGLNINRNSGSIHPHVLSEAVKQHRAELGIAFDGDGDRVIMVDDRGEVVDGDELLYIIACERLWNGHQPSAVVGTVMSNLGLEIALNALDLDFQRVKVGDRYILERLHRANLLLGGESSGHIICLDKSTTGDGIISSLQVLIAIVNSRRSLHELKSGMRKFPQEIINVPVACKFDLKGCPPVQSAVREVENQLGKRGRVLLRPSGTEPVIRVMVEGEDAQQVQALARDLAVAVKQAMVAA